VVDNGGETGVVDNGGETGVVDNGGETGVVDNGDEIGVIDNGGETGVVDNGGETGVVDNGGETGGEMDRDAETSNADDRPLVGDSAQITANRKRARSSLLRQAEKMLKRSRVVNAPGDVGDNVTVPVPLVDRGRGDPRNLLGIILDRDENEMYRIAVRAGILTGKYSRNQFDLCSQKLLTDKEVRLDREVVLRTAVTDESTCGGQGFVRCNCAGSNRCQSNRCKCFKAQVKCNSRCHSCLACDNKS